MWFYVEDGCPGQINTCISRILVPYHASPMQYLSHWKLSPTTAPTEAFCGKPAPPPPPLHCSTVLTRASFIKNTDVAGRTSPGPLFCARSTVERNSIFQGDDVRSANMETGDWEQSRCRVAEVAGMFWPHIICCDSSQDNACTWSIWQDVRYRFTLCVGVVGRASVQVKRQNNVMWQEAALQKRLFRAQRRNEHPKTLVFSLKNQVVYFLDFLVFFVFWCHKHRTTYCLLTDTLWFFNSMNIHVPGAAILH